MRNVKETYQELLPGFSVIDFLGKKDTRYKDARNLLSALAPIISIEGFRVMSGYVNYHVQKPITDLNHFYDQIALFVSVYTDGRLRKVHLYVYTVGKANSTNTIWLIEGDQLRALSSSQIAPYILMQWPQWVGYDDVAE